MIINQEFRGQRLLATTENFGYKAWLSFHVNIQDILSISWEVCQKRWEVNYTLLYMCVCVCVSYIPKSALWWCDSSLVSMEATSTQYVFHHHVFLYKFLKLLWLKKGVVSEWLIYSTFWWPSPILITVVSRKGEKVTVGVSIFF